MNWKKKLDLPREGDKYILRRDIDVSKWGYEVHWEYDVVWILTDLEPVINLQAYNGEDNPIDWQMDKKFLDKYFSKVN